MAGAGRHLLHKQMHTGVEVEGALAGVAAEVVGARPAGTAVEEEEGARAAGTAVEEEGARAGRLVEGVRARTAAAGRQVEGARAAAAGP